MKVDKDKKHRNKTLRSYIVSRTWDKNPEFLMVREVVQNLRTKKPNFDEFKYVYDYEWEYEPGLSHLGKGDLVFTDGKNKFLIVECKKKNPQEVCQQTIGYIEKFALCHKEAKVIKGLAVTSNGWHVYSSDLPYWELDIAERERSYYKLFDTVENPKVIEKRDSFQKIYRDEGLLPNNPVNALNGLSVQGIINISYEFSSSFKCEVTIKFLRGFKNQIFSGKGARSNKKEAKIQAAANLCDKIFLPYHMKDHHYLM